MEAYSLNREPVRRVAGHVAGGASGQDRAARARGTGNVRIRFAASVRRGYPPQWPEIGVAPAGPYEKTRSAAPPALAFRRNQAPVVES